MSACAEIHDKYLSFDISNAIHWFWSEYKKKKIVFKITLLAKRVNQPRNVFPLLSYFHEHRMDLLLAMFIGLSITCQLDNFFNRYNFQRHLAIISIMRNWQINGIVVHLRPKIMAKPDAHVLPFSCYGNRLDRKFFRHFDFWHDCFSNKTFAKNY